MSRPLVYIAGPYAAPTDAERRENIERVVALSRWLVEEGYAPVQVHTGVDWEAYGDDDDPPARVMGLEAACALVEAVARSGGALIVIAREDATLSPGTAQEVTAWERVADRSGRVVIARWAIWQTWCAVGALPWELAVLRSGR